MSRVGKDRGEPCLCTPQRNMGVWCYTWAVGECEWPASGLVARDLCV